MESVDERDRLAAEFEQHRTRLRGVAYRMLGSLGEADDAVQEAWLRLSRTERDEIDNLAAWLTTVVARICLNLLRARENRREEPLDGVDGGAGSADPAEEAALADSVGVALLVVLDLLSPAERVAFVLHDLFAVPFDEIGTLLDKSPAAARQLASRARRRVRGADPAPADHGRRREVVDAFLAASRGGDFGALVALLDPDVVLHADAAAGPAPAPLVLRGAAQVAKGAIAAGSARAAFSGPALVNGSPGVVLAPHGKVFLVLSFTVEDDRITAIDIIAEPERLRGVEIAVLGD
ncbi:sigma-70 family RNA polymerase sigma factor [Amycolatopsis albispora]|uniref:RNA polymerase subunit sigma-70 n=1 Tax=Amycolatopsis albispora TaxID=1804986 RepID=A0A344L5S9_9PSEU|nr:sigma-70 family RNA polymerase sigma factor [Amycolatopsis albispora]AXB43403.1 RNA polymerase subunit sigma-70 [Amycolatopsis albispora]